MAATTVLQSYPHVEITVYDMSKQTPTTRLERPLHRMLMPLKAERGRFGVSWFDNFNEAEAEFGTATFDITSEYYGVEQVFIEHAFRRHGMFMCRLADNKASAANRVIEMHVQDDVEIPKYKKDVDGFRVIDEDGDYIVELDPETNEELTVIGTKISFIKRMLKEASETTDTEEYNEILQKTVEVDGKTTLILPLVGSQVTSPGKFGNGCGLKLWHDINSEYNDIGETLKSQFFNFTPVDKVWGSDTATPVRDVWNNVYSAFVFPPNQVDKGTTRLVSWDDVLRTNYTKNNPLPYNIHFYSENIKHVSEMVAAHEGILTPNQVDILSGKNNDGTLLDHLQIDNSDPMAVLFNENYIVYCEGGDDGTLTTEAFRDLYRQVLNFEVYPDLVDKGAYDITHLYDCGYDLETKYAFIRFLTRRTDTKIILSTQDTARRPNTKAEDISTLTALRARCLLQPESVIGNTGCCRADIFMHTGPVLDTIFKTHIPLTLWSLIKRAEYQASDYISDTPKGDPNALVTQWEHINWIATDEDIKQRSWKLGGNYIQTYKYNVLHYPDVHSVYESDSSVLSDPTYTDFLVYAKHKAREIWAKHSGRDLDDADLFDLIRKDYQTELKRISNGRYDLGVSVFITEEERLLGYVVHIRVEIFGNIPKRVHAVDFLCKRKNNEVI